MLGEDLSEVLTEDLGALVAEESPEVFDKRLGEEDEALAHTIFKVDVEVVVADAVRVWTQLGEHLLREPPLFGNLGRLDHDVERQLGALASQDIVRDVQDLAKQMT